MTTSRPHLFFRMLDATVDTIDGNTASGLRKLATIGLELYQEQQDDRTNLNRMFFGPASGPRPRPAPESHASSARSYEARSTCTKCGFKAPLDCVICPRCGNKGFFDPIPPG